MHPCLLVLLLGSMFYISLIKLAPFIAFFPSKTGLLLRACSGCPETDLRTICPLSLDCFITAKNLLAETNAHGKWKPPTQSRNIHGERERSNSATSHNNRRILDFADRRVDVTTGDIGSRAKFSGSRRPHSNLWDQRAGEETETFRHRKLPPAF